MYVGGGAYFALNPLSEVRANVMVVVPKDRLGGWSRDVDAGVGGEAAALGRGERSFAGAARLGARVSIGPLAHDVRRPIAPGACWSATRPVSSTRSPGKASFSR